MSHLRLAGALLCLAVAACGDAPEAEDAPTVSEAEVDTLLAPGQEHYWQADYDSARIVWGAALERTQIDGGDSLDIANLMSWIGLAAWRDGDYVAAREMGEAGLAIRLDLGSLDGLARSYIALGLLAQDENRLHDARSLYGEARDAAVASGEEDIEGMALGNLGLVSAYLGDLDTAADMLREMQRVGRETDDERLEANALTNLAMVSVWAGDPGAAIAPLDTARVLYASLEYPLGEQYALGQLATARSAMGQYDQALAALDSALVLSRLHGMRDHEAENLGLLGGLYAEVGDDRRALRHLDEAAALASELGLGFELGNALRRSAVVRHGLGSTDRAFTDARGAAEAHGTSGYAFEEIDDLIVLAELHRASGNTAEAAAMLRSAGLLADRVDAPSARGAVALAEARHAELGGDFREVLEAAARVNDASLPADFRMRMQSHMLAARAYAGLARLDSAAIEGRAALSALERVRGGIASDELRGGFAAASARAYGDVVLILLQLDQAEEAFAVADAARSRELLERLAAARASADEQGRIEDPAVASQELAEAELLLRRIDALLAQLRDMETTPAVERGPGAAATSDDILEQIERLREEYEALTIRTARRHPRSAAMLGAVRTDAARVRAVVAEDEALVHYTLTADELVVFVVRHDRFESLRISVAAADVASRVRLLREIWSDREGDREAGLPVAHGLHEILVAPLARAGLLDDASRLVVVPHGILEQLPFAALLDAVTGRFLVEDYVISYLRSASLLPALRAAEPPGAASAAGLSAFAPFPTPLPGTRAEADEASRSQPRSALLVGRRATEGAVRRALTESRVVHVASHGVLNARNPMFSRIELARGGGESSGDDGRLEVHEVLGLTVKSSLVVLSGCETAMVEDWSGDPLRPAGVATLGQAFLHAGARNVVATLWRIDDEGSAALVGGLYEHLGGDVAAALALAQRTLIEGPEYRAPYYWAGFVLSGEGGL